MIWNLDPAWLMMAVAFVMVLAMFFGAALDVIMGDDGFGPIGNMLLFTVGFFAAILAVLLAVRAYFSIRNRKPVSAKA